MTHVQRNPNPWPATLPEYRDDDGTVWPTREVPPLGEVTWPVRIAGFEGFPEPEPEPEPDIPVDEIPVAQQAKTDEPTDTAEPAATPKNKRTAASAAAGGKEA